MITIIEKTEGNKFEFKFQKADIMTESIVGKETYKRQMKKFNVLLNLELEEHNFGKFDEKKKEAVSTMCRALYTIDFDQYAQANIHANIEFIANGLFNLKEVKEALKDSDEKYFWTNFPTQLKEYLYASMLEHHDFKYYVDKCVGKYEDSNESVQAIIPVNAEKNKSEKVITNAVKNKSKKVITNAVKNNIPNENIKDVPNENIKDVKDQDIYDETNEINLGAYLDKEQVLDFIQDNTGLELKDVSKTIIENLKKINIAKDDLIIVYSNMIKNKDKIKSTLCNCIYDILLTIESSNCKVISDSIGNIIDTFFDKSLTMNQRFDQIASLYNYSLIEDDEEKICINTVKEYDKIKNIILNSIFELLSILLNDLDIDKELINKSIIEIFNKIDKDFISNAIILTAEKSGIETNRLKEELQKIINETTQTLVAVNADEQTKNAQDAGKVLNFSNQGFWDGSVPGPLIHE